MAGDIDQCKGSVPSNAKINKQKTDRQQMIVRRLKDKETERHRWTMGYAKPRCSINSQSNSLIHIIMNEVLNNE